MAHFVHWIQIIPSFWDLVALMISAVSLLYTFFSNRYSVDLTNFQLEEDREQLLFSYQITNDSSKTLKVYKISMFSNGKKISVLNFDTMQYDEDENEKNALQWDREHTDSFLSRPIGLNPYRIANLNNFSSIEEPEFPLMLSPYSQTSLSFYVPTKPDKLTVYANKRLGISKHKSFTTN